ncbi:MAG: hypothetical protein HYS74_02710 [Parcubacteria group bacterium]|nr:hypothetical protein [Parcubacteria group bacterium]
MDSIRHAKIVKETPMRLETYTDTYKRHIKDADKLVETITFFNNDPEMSFIFKKTNRLVLAIYVLLDHINDKEPLKWELRGAAMEFLIAATSFGAHGRLGTDDSDLEASSDRLLRVLQTSVYLRFLSLSHFSILQNEHRIVGELCRSCRNRLAASKNVSFSVATEDGDVRDAIKYSQDTAPYHKGRKGQYKGHDTGLSYTDGKIIGSNVANQDKKQRRESIIRLLDSRQGINIKDITAVIRGCSEKTIQRELNELIGEGSIRREGERRWSTYFRVEKQV